MGKWILKLDLRAQAAIFSLVATGIVYGSFGVVRHFISQPNTPILITPSILFPAFSLMFYRRRETFPQSTKPSLSLMMKLNIAGYIVGIVGACILLIVPSFLISWLGAGLSIFGFLQFGSKLQAAKAEQQPGI